MKKQFITPVSMVVTKEQYETHLKDELIKMGYKEDDVSFWDNANILVNNLANLNGRISNTINGGEFQHNRSFISEFNPQLFLALAAMTNNEYGNFGEYWKFNMDRESYDFVKGKLYKQIKDNVNDQSAFEVGEKCNGFQWQNTKKFVKATKEEIINHFTINNITTNPCAEINLGSSLLNKYRKETITISYSQAQEIIDVACIKWKEMLFKLWGKQIVLKENIDVEYMFYKEMRKACTPVQHELFDKIFGKDKIEIEWDKIKTGSKVKLTGSNEQCGLSSIHNVIYEVVFWKTPHFINNKKVFKPIGLESSYCTFYDFTNDKYLLFSSERNTNYVTEVIEY